MAAKRGEESKQGLIIALVCFVLLSIVLGVTTYLFYDGQQALRDKAKKSDDSLKAMEKSRNWEAFQKLYLKTYLGQPLTAKEKDEFAASLQDYNSNRLGDADTKPEFDTLAKLLRDKMGWNDTTSQPKQTYLTLVDEQEKNLQQKKELLAAATKSSEEAQKKFDDDVASLRKANDQKNQEVARLNDELKNLIPKKSQEFMALDKQVRDAQVEVDRAKKEKEDAKDEATKTHNKLAKELKEKDNQIGQLRDQIKPPNLLDYDKPRGKIINIERGQSVVYINLGSADRVKPQLTFAIYGVGPNGRALAQPKGTLEVENVNEAHLSRARVTSLTSPNLNPVVVGDLLFNPVWNSSLRTHVAIAGVIDLTGEGTNDTAEFIKGLERQDIVVDAWLDLKDLTIKGKGITNKTMYLVLGDQPEFGELGAPQGDRLSADKAALIKKMSEMQDKAAKEGATVVPYRRFLTVIGYPLPRALTTRSSSLDSLLMSTGAARREAEKDQEEKPAPKGKAKDEGKEKEK